MSSQRFRTPTRLHVEPASLRYSSKGWAAEHAKVIGPRGGRAMVTRRTTYCTGMQQLLEALKRPRTLINLDPANDELPYHCDIDVRELVNVEDVMNELDLGPNGALLYAMEYIEVNLDWLITKIRSSLLV
eukprot:Skav220044  [mRNA]  locus=scaffold2981:332208:337026:- [translate_table: standard]